MGGVRIWVAGVFGELHGDVSRESITCCMEIGSRDKLLIQDS